MRKLLVPVTAIVLGFFAFASAQLGGGDDHGDFDNPRHEKSSDSKYVHRNKAFNHKGKFDCSKKFDKAMRMYNRGFYSSATQLFDDIRANCGGYTGLDSILYYGGMSKLKTHQETEAAFDFRDLATSYPKSPFADEASFRVLYCNYSVSPKYQKEQTKTEDAIVAIHDYLDNNPPAQFADSAKHWLSICNRKLVTKDIATAQFYERIKKYESAVIYFQSILEKWPGDSTNAECQLSMGRDLVRINRYSEASKVLGDLVESGVDNQYTKKAKGISAKINKSNGNGRTSKEILDDKPGH